MKKKRILLIIPNLGRGGAQRVFHQQLETLSNHFDVTGCVFNWDDSFDTDRTKRIYSLDVPAGRNYIEKFYYFLLRIIRLRRLKKVHRTDLSISHLEGADYVNVLSHFGKTICWIHGSKKFDQNISGVLGFLRHNILMPSLYQQADTIVTVSKGIVGEIISYLGNTAVSIQTIYNGFDIAGIKKQSLEPIENDIRNVMVDDHVIATHCRLSTQKNLPALLSIIARIRKSEPVKLVLIGDGELRTQLIDHSRKLGLSTWSVWEGAKMTSAFDVYFLGHADNPLRILRHAKLYVMTSLWEGFPLALCEAIIIGLPVIAADCYTGPREILDPGLELPQPVDSAHPTPLGTLMPVVKTDEPSKIALWATVICEMLTRDDKQGNEIADFRMREFSQEASIRRTVEVINKVCEPAGD